MIELQFCGSHNTITVSFPMFGMKRNQTPAPTVLEMDSISHFSALDPNTGSVRARNASYQPTVSLLTLLSLDQQQSVVLFLTNGYTTLF